MKYLKSTHNFLLELLVDDMDDFEDVKIKTLNKRIKKTKSIIQQFFVLVITRLISPKKRSEKGNFLRKEENYKNIGSRKFILVDMQYILCIKIIEFLDLF